MSTMVSNGALYPPTPDNCCYNSSLQTNSSEKGGVGCGGGGGDEGDEKANDEKPGEKKHVLKEYRHNVASDDEGHLKYKLKDNLLHCKYDE